MVVYIDTLMFLGSRCTFRVADLRKYLKACENEKIGITEIYSTSLVLLWSHSERKKSGK